METFLITGGAGFIGATMALGLRAAYPKARIVALDNLRRRGSELNLSRLRDAGIDFQHGDVRAPQDLAAVGGADLLVECSAEPAVTAGYGGAPRYVLDTNLGGMVNCLDCCREWRAAMLFLSTSRVYPLVALRGLELREAASRFELSAEQPAGASAAGISENFSLEGARSLYGATKLCGELLLTEYREMFSMRAIINRCSLIAGPWQMGTSEQGLVAYWAARHVFGGALRYIGHGGRGKQVRDVLHVDDLVRLLLLQIERLDALDGRVFNVGGGLERSVSLLELTQVCRDISGNIVEVGSEPNDRPADLPLYVTDNARVSEATGWRPERALRDTVGDTIQWMERHRDALAPVFLK